MNLDSFKSFTGKSQAVWRASIASAAAIASSSTRTGGRRTPRGDLQGSLSYIQRTKKVLANQWLKFLDGRNKSKCPYICMILKYFKCLHAGVQSTKRNAKIKSLLVPPKRPGKQPSRASQGLQRVKPSKHAQWTEPQLLTCLPNDKMTAWIVSIAVEESRVGFYDSIHFIHLHWLCKLSM